MATTLSSLGHAMNPLDASHVKPEKIHEEEYEINRWFDTSDSSLYPSMNTSQTPSSKPINSVSTSPITNNSPFPFPSSYFSPNNSTFPINNSTFFGSTPINGTQQTNTINSVPQPYSTQFSPPMPPSFPFVLPSGVPQNFMNFNPANFNFQMNPQFYQLFSQFQQFFNKNSVEELADDKKRRMNRNFPRRLRTTRPKVVESKGAIQCKGRNRKKGTQCRNAALMEFMGPRPIYCAEHIELDPQSLYEKCKAGYQKEPGDNKSCKEVVLKEFGYCYKHYADVVAQIIERNDIQKAQHHQERINELLSQLEKEAAAAKKKDGDLYQRKNKLIPKFQEMKKLVTKAIYQLQSAGDRLPKDVSPLSSDDLDQVNDLTLSAPDFQLLPKHDEDDSTESSNDFDTAKLIDPTS